MKKGIAVPSYQEGGTLQNSRVQNYLLVVQFFAVGADAEFMVVEGLAGSDVEFPLVPGAFEDFAFAGVGHAGEAVGADEGAEAAAAEGAGPVRADVAEGVVVAVEVEDADFAAVNGYDFAAAGGISPAVAITWAGSGQCFCEEAEEG